MMKQLLFRLSLIHESVLLSDGIRMVFRPCNKLMFTKLFQIRSDVLNVNKTIVEFSGLVRIHFDFTGLARHILILSV